MNRTWLDPRESRAPMAALFLVALVLVVDDARPGGVLGGGLWIPVLYAIVPAVVGLLAYIRTRAAAGRDSSPFVLLGLVLWGVIGGLAALAVVIVVGLGAPPTNPQSGLLRLVRGLVTYLVPVGVFVGMYGDAGRRPRLQAVALVAATPFTVALVLGGIVWLT